MALGYISSKASSSTLKTRLNIPSVLVLSVLPDGDLLVRDIFPFIQHRGATHSILSALIVFAPFLIIYHRRAVPYFIALVQHGLVGDYIAGGQVQLLWPLTQMYFGTGLDNRSLTNQTLEWIIFLAAMTLMLKIKDYRTFLEPHVSSLILMIPAFMVLLLLGTPSELPLSLVPPHIFCLITFAVAILVELINARPKQETT